MEEIKKFQKKLVNSCKEYLNKESFFFDVSISPLCFFTTWAETPGKLKLDYFINRRFNYFFFFKNILSISKNFDLDIFFNKENCIKSKAENIIVSYCSQKNFDAQNNFIDTYFNYSSHKDANLVWFLISLDNYIPQNIPKNLVIVAKKKNNSSNFIYFFNYFFQLFLKEKFNIKKIKHCCWREYDLSEKISNLFFSCFKINIIKNVILNYESIPFQNLLLKKIKQKNNKIKTIGYLHCAPWPLQLDLIYKGQPLDELIVSGLDQKKVLKKYLGWNKVKILVYPSFRFSKKKKKEFSGFIFLPFNLKKQNNYLLRLENYFKELPPKTLNPLKPRIHPLNQSSNIHQNFANELKILLKKNKNKFSNLKKNTSIFLGSATGVCIQTIEEGNKVIHLPENKLIDVFHKYFWRNIKVSYVDKDIFIYEILKKNSLFHLNKNLNNFKKYLIKKLN